MNKLFKSNQLSTNEKNIMLARQKRLQLQYYVHKRLKRENEEPTKDGKQQKRRGLSPTKDDGKWSKKKGSYTNWFQPHLCPPIIATIKKHGNNSGALHFLKNNVQEAQHAKSL